MLLVSVGLCAGAAFYRFALESVVLKKRRKKRCKRTKKTNTCSRTVAKE